MAKAFWRRRNPKTYDAGCTATASVTQPSVVAALAPVVATVGIPFTGSVQLSPTTTDASVLAPAWAASTFNTTTKVLTVAGTPLAVGPVQIQVQANTECGGAPQAPITLDAGVLTVSAVPACDPPQLVATLAPATAPEDTLYVGTVQLALTTSVTVLGGLDAWATPAFNPSTQLLTITGTPTDPGTMGPLQLELTNACGGGATTAVVAVAAGSLTITAAPPPPSGGTLTVEWTPEPGVDGYRVYYSTTDSGPLPPAGASEYNVAGGASSQAIIAGLPSATYYVWVASHIAGDHSDPVRIDQVEV